MNLAVRYEDDAADRRHVPVMVEEVCGLLSAHGPLAFVDVTVGTGGHAAAMLRATKARMLGLDRDAAAIAVARDRLGEFGDRVVLERADFGELAAVMKQHHFDGADAILADLGMSSYALDDPNRGFSFRLDGPLDMRMDDRQTLQAKDIVNEESAEELARIIYTYGEERGSRRIARMIVEARRRGPIETTGELRAIVERALGAHRRGGAHPATRTFQALAYRGESRDGKSRGASARRSRDAQSGTGACSSSRITRSRIVRSRSVFASWCARAVTRRFRAR